MRHLQRFHADPHGRARQHAIVIGGSMAGLLAAHVLARHFGQVTVVERDILPAGPAPRKGTPHARHVHVLLARGQEILDYLFPDLSHDLRAAGAPRLVWTRAIAGCLAWGWTPRFDSGLASFSCSRDLLEYLVRCQVRANSRITFETETAVTLLTATSDGRRLTGVTLQKRGAPQTTLAADLVVDASGRNSKLPDWLRSLGYNAPAETHVDAALGYATRWYRAPERPPGEWQAALIGTRVPDIPRGAVLLPAENGLWVITLAGTAGHYPPTDEAGFHAFSRQLLTPLIADAIAAAEPLTPIYGYRRTANRWRHYERLRRWPAGLVVLGDAVCAFNPIYGQGMTVSAQAAVMLDAALALEATPGLAFQRQLARMLRTPWLLATGEDFRWEQQLAGQRPSLPDRLMHRYIEAVLSLIPHYPDICHTFFQISHLTTPPSQLFRPRILGRALPRFLRPPTPPPAVPPYPAAE